MAFQKPIKWSSFSLSTLELVEDYKGRLPIIAIVTKGYYGEDEIDTIASNQVKYYNYIIAHKLSFTFFFLSSFYLGKNFLVSETTIF